MKVLAIETSMGRTSVALRQGSGSKLIVERLHQSERQAENLITLVEKLMQEARHSFFDLDRIAVCIGPGGFSGVRTGVAAARGIAMTARLPIVGATSFRLMVNALLKRDLPVRTDEVFGILAPAGVDQFYCQIFGGEGGAETEIRALNAAEAHELFASRVFAVAGPSKDAIARCGLSSLEWEGEEIWPDAGELAELAPKLNPEKDLAFPYYVRPPDARPQTGYSVSRKTDHDLQPEYR